MQVSGSKTIYLPNVERWSFAVTGIKIPNMATTPAFSFIDNTGHEFVFGFNEGFVSGPINGNSINLTTYNTSEITNIYGYVSGNALTYKVNDVLVHTAIPNWGLISSMVFSGGTSPVLGDVLIKSRNINVKTTIAPTYNSFGNLTGTIVSDAAMMANPASINFYNTNKALLALSSTLSGSFSIPSGNTTISLTDIDDAFVEYTNEFSLSIPVPFGNIGGKFTSNRTGITSKTILYLADSPNNIYYKPSPYKGYVSGGKYYPSPEVQDYDIVFNYSNKNLIGDSMAASLNIMFKPIGPVNMAPILGGYVHYLTANGGQYEKVPSVVAKQYYYITGLQNDLSSFLFCTGCANELQVTFSGGNPISGASGKLFLKPVTLSGVYGQSLNKFFMVSGYSGQSFGSAYQSAPTFSISTGGACWSVPDKSGSELYQFRKASGYGAVYAQAAGLTGLVLMSGTQATGIQLTNAGFGYDNTTLIPQFSLVRASGDTGVADANCNWNFVAPGAYDFDYFWKATADVNGNGAVAIPVNASGWYSGNYNIKGDGKLRLRLTCSGINNYSPLSGLLSVSVTGNGYSITSQKFIYQYRIFDMFSGLLLPSSFPAYTGEPVVDTSYNMDDNQFDALYASMAGLKNGNNLIEF